MTQDDLRAAFDRLHADSRSQPAPDAAARRAALATLGTVVLDNADAFCRRDLRRFRGPLA